MKLKQMGIALIAAGMLSANAYASEVAIEQALAPQAAFSETDLNALFEQEMGKPMQLAALSEQEMRETEGASWYHAVYHGLGALAGMYGGGYGYLAGGGRNPRAFIGAALTGAATGAWSPVKGFRSAAAVFGSHFTGGVIGGYGSRRGWW